MATNLSVKAQKTQSQKTYSQNQRQSSNYQPTVWSHSFIQSLKNENADLLYKDKARKLEEETRAAIYSENEDFLTILELIDDIQRLGLAFRFEKDIKRVLDRFVDSEGRNLWTQKSLHATSLMFRLLRQHGYEVSQDEFKNFMDDKDNLLAIYKKDVKGMLSLYEASSLGFEGEDLLDEAMAQTRTHLINTLQKGNLSELDNSTMEISISHALELPLYRRMVMLKARWYIEAYNKRKNANHSLLQLAKINFNMVQSILQRDLKEMSRWWNNLGLAGKLTFSRDRLMECFFWTVGIEFEPQFSSCRKGLTKVGSFITIIDDVYDVYGTLDELELFTDVVERWDIDAVKDLPEYMKLCFLALYNTVNEMTYDTLAKHGEFVHPYLKKSWADLCKAFLQEAKWRHKKLTPSFNEYIENGWRSVSGTVILMHAYLLLDQKILKQGLDSLVNHHHILKWPSVVFRLCNDLATSSGELDRGETINSISCYMDEHGVSEEYARKEINKMIDNAWKKMNQYNQTEVNSFTKLFIEASINLARISQCVYQHGDGHGAPDTNSKKRVVSLIIEPISKETLSYDRCIYND
uniref:Uncharacterized protein n=1 Tax=Manihot esculenta TaxID=3983 RepID=A0A2C9UU87_MANES